MYGNLLAYINLIKYKLSLAVALSSVAGYFLSCKTFDIHLSFLVIGVFLLASGSAVLNQYTERRTDSFMGRTKDRPIPSKKISEKRALLITSILLLSGSLFLYFNGLTSFFLGIFNVLLYNVVYTQLKKKTILSIIPGALVGAVPPVIGYSSAGGAYFHPNIIIFSAFMFLWQLPHFWLIIIKYGKEYKAAGFATISNYLSEIQIRYLVFFWIVLSTGFLLIFSMKTIVINNNSLVFLLLLNLMFIFFFYRLLFYKKKPEEIKGAFFLINSFSIIIMVLLITISILKGN